MTIAPAARLRDAAVPALFVLLWSTGFIGAKLGLPYTEPFTFLLIRFAVVLPVLAAAAIIMRAPWPRDPLMIGRIALVGVALHGLYLGGVFVAIASGVPAAVTALIVGVQPLLTAAIAWLYLGERLRPIAWFGLVLGFAGVILVVADKLELGRATLGGIAAAIIALVAITLGTLYQKRHATQMNLITGSAVQFMAAALAMLPLAFIFETREVIWTGSFVFAVLWLALVLSIGAITLLHLLIRRGAAAKVASLFYLTPSVTALIAWPLFGETLTTTSVAGFVLSAMGVAMVTRT
jgi:drug/metabolite transporter (DMT)-like permease